MIAINPLKRVGEKTTKPIALLHCKTPGFVTKFHPGRKTNVGSK